MSTKPYPSDVSDEEWSFAAPYLALIDEQAPQRRHSLREVFNALRWLARAGAAWRMLPNDLPPWPVVYQQFRRWDDAGCFAAMVGDLRSIIRSAQGRQGQPSAVIIDGRTLQSSCESGPRAGYDGYKRRKGSKVHMAVDTLGHLIALTVTPANESEKRLCTAAPTLGGRAQLWLASPLQAAEPRFRTHAGGIGRAAFRGLCHADVAQSGPAPGFRSEFITPANWAPRFEAKRRTEAGSEVREIAPDLRRVDTPW